MSRRVGYIIIFLFTINNCRGDVPAHIIRRFRQIIILIKENKVNELSAMVEYPLKRENPLPDINSPERFIVYYPILIDKAFRAKIRLYNDSDIFEHHGQYGLVGGPFSGEVWIDENGKIAAINYSSPKEIELKNQLTKQIQAHIYPAINSWVENILVCRSKTLLIRVDSTSKGIRYVSWSKGRSMSEKPDLILNHGVEEAQGTMGGWTWTFKNGDWTYIVDDVEMCESDKGCGWFLRLFYKGKMQSPISLKETK